MGAGAREPSGVFWALLVVSPVLGAASVPYIVAITSQFPGAADRALGASGERLYLFAALQSLLLTVPTAAIGLFLAPRVGLGMVTAPVRVAVRRGLITGLGVGMVLLAGSAAAARHLPEISVRPPEWWKGLLASLSAGVNEEIWFRLGVMTALVAGMDAIRRRVGGSGGGVAEASVPRGADASAAAPAEAEAEAEVKVARVTAAPAWIYVTASAIAALLFGAMHLPQADALAGLTPAVVAYTLLGNGVAGTVFGWLYWKLGLVSAMVAHFSTDILLHVIAPLLGP